MFIFFFAITSITSTPINRSQGRLLVYPLGLCRLQLQGSKGNAMKLPYINGVLAAPMHWSWLGLLAVVCTALLASRVLALRVSLLRLCILFEREALWKKSRDRVRFLGTLAAPVENELNINVLTLESYQMDKATEKSNAKMLYEIEAWLIQLEAHKIKVTDVKHHQNTLFCMQRTSSLAVPAAVTTTYYYYSKKASFDNSLPRQVRHLITFPFATPHCPFHSSPHVSNFLHHRRTFWECFCGVVEERPTPVCFVVTSMGFTTAVCSFRNRCGFATYEDWPASGIVLDIAALTMKFELRLARTPLGYAEIAPYFVDYLGTHSSIYLLQRPRIISKIFPLCTLSSKPPSCLLASKGTCMHLPLCTQNKKIQGYMYLSKSKYEESATSANQRKYRLKNETRQNIHWQPVYQNRERSEIQMEPNVSGLQELSKVGVITGYLQLTMYLNWD
ncbi:uncharacterized protein EDB91DRAFT_1087810 [Suillus paluster]|uniref:uncharacterized protein n=1 Tax=Suillus paluster TaxID=48578 RepID=UPI001B86149B|nr:uncharacterized protein EDB91DRAFT_1087810 [Suillus paluster]KAG1723411.1 hypothetical protein EDB91DRAFT_1087810 [Suillus paluster]